MDLMTFLVQSPAQSSLKSEARPVGWGLCLAESWKPPRTETVQHLWAACSIAGLSSGWKSFSLCLVWTSLFILCPLPLVLSPQTTTEDHGQLSHWTPRRSGCPLSGHLFSRFKKHQSLSCSKQVLQTPEHLGGPSLNSLYFISVSCTRETKPCHRI